jgi:putative mRNA 3-end processing factor
LSYGHDIVHNGVRITLLPAGHLLGSAQVRLEHCGQVWIVSGDYKLHRDPTCQPFEPARCHVFITESTFGLPIYRWPAPERIFGDINDWWRANQAAEKTSIIYCYTLGKAQRLLGGVDASIGPIYTHGAVERMTQAYRESGVELPPTMPVPDAPQDTLWGRGLVLAPPSAHGTTWLRRFGAISTAMASGWMLIRGTRRRRSIDRGFPLSDHADWPGLLQAIAATQAEQVWVTHGYANILARWLREQGLEARTLSTRYEGEVEDGE